MQDHIAISVSILAPRKMKKQVALKKNLKVRVRVKRVKADTRKITDDRNCLRDEQRKIRGRFEEIERQCHQLKMETEIIIKQSVRTQVKVVVMFQILKAREGGDFIKAAALTRFLREFVAKERKCNLVEVKKENPWKTPQRRERTRRLRF